MAEVKARTAALDRERRNLSTVIQSTAAAWPHKGHYLRIHAGLEDQDDLIGDLEGSGAA